MTAKTYNVTRRFGAAPAAMVLCVCLLLSEAATPAGAQMHDYTYFLNELVNLDGLPLIQNGVRCAQNSSGVPGFQYNPTQDLYYDAVTTLQADGGHYLSIDKDTGEGVMADLEGPGCIFRIWSGNPRGVIRFYLDGAKEPTYEFDFEKLMSGKIEPFNRPLVWQRSAVLGQDRLEGRSDVDFRFWGMPTISRTDVNKASVCYLPIPFAKSCRVTTVLVHDKTGMSLRRAPQDLYYHVGYKLYPKDWQVETFSLPLKPRYKAKLEEVSRLWNACGEDPQPAAGAKTSEATITIQPGKTAAIFDMTGPAAIRQFCAKVTSKDAYATRNVVLRASWDGEKTPSILTPIGDFFGRAVGKKDYRSLALGMTDDMDYCYWRMPFRKQAVFTVENQGSEDVVLKYRFVYTPGAVPDNAAYFHARWRRDAGGEAFDYRILDCDGSAGVFLGDIVMIDHIERSRWWGEGNEKIFVDGEKDASTFGTGTEDYFGDAWGIRWFVNPCSGCPQNEGRQQLMYRWHISDSIPFANSLRFDLENYSAAGRVLHNGYTSVAYWYQMPGGKDFFPAELPSPVDRRPSPDELIPDSMEAERIFTEPSQATVVSDSAGSRDYSWGHAVRPKGETIELKVPADSEAVYAVALFSGLDKPLPQESFTLLQNGKPAGEYVHLYEGNNHLTVKFKSPAAENVTLDYITVVPTNRRITDDMNVITEKFTDDFSSYRKGTSGQPVWRPGSGNWIMQDGEYHQLLTDGYDYFSAANAWVKGDYRIQTKIRLVSGFLEGGLMFNMSSRQSSSSCQMVRFNGSGKLWYGSFDSGGAYDLEQAVSTGLKKDADGWITLTITVRNSKGAYDIAIDGKQAAEGVKLVYVPTADKPQCVALVSCRGHTAFDDVTITPINTKTAEKGR